MNIIETIIIFIITIIAITCISFKIYLFVTNVLVLYDDNVIKVVNSCVNILNVSICFCLHPFVYFLVNYIYMYTKPYKG